MRTLSIGSCPKRAKLKYMAVTISDMVDALTMGGMEMTGFYDRKNDELVWVTDDQMRRANTDNDDEFEDAVRNSPAWEEDPLRDARRVLTWENDASGTNDDAFIILPDEGSVHMHSIMEDFVLTLPESEQQRRLWEVLHGPKAFRRFKDTVSQYDLWEAWNRYHDDRLAEIAREWAAENNVPLAEDPPTPSKRKKKTS